jgi:recombinational DNA repair ATPase RecF
MKRASASVRRFTYIEPENWRNFTKVQVVLQRRMFLVGANASG